MINGSIYMVTCKINNKRYIGQTIKTVNKRFSEHKYNHISKSNNLLNRAILKYGIDNFSFDVLDTRIITQEQLDILEILYISAYKSITPFGYNIKIGGRHAPKPLSISDDNLEKFIEVAVDKSLSTIAAQFNVSVRAVQNFIKKHNIKRTKFKRKAKTTMINFDEFISLYSSNMKISVIASKLNISQSFIYNYIKQHKITKRYKSSIT